MTKQEAIAQAKKILSETGETQALYRRGDKYKTFPVSVPMRGWKVADMISRFNVQAY